MHEIAILDDYQNVALEFGDWEGLRSHARITVFNDVLKDEDALVKRLERFDVLCVMRERTRLSRTLLSRLPKLRLIATTGPWNAAIDMQAAEDLGITVCGTGTSPTATPELTWALIFAAMRRLDRELPGFRQGGWQVSVGTELSGGTLGILGLGRAGGGVARMARAFGMRVIAWSQNLTPERAAEQGVEYVSKESLFRDSDIVSIHVRLSDRTRDLVGARELAWMRRSAWLINTARGPIVNEDALCDALQHGLIAGAAVDVHDPEPLPADHRLRRLDNFIGTSHIGYVTRRSYGVYYGQSVENIAAWIKGQPIRVLSMTQREIDY